MPISLSVQFISSNRKIVDITASANFDTNVTIVHLLGEVPIEVYMMPLSTNYHISQWMLVSKNANTVRLRKRSVGGSGSPLPQCRVYINKLHSLTR